MPRTIFLDSFPLSSVAKRESPFGERPTQLDICHQWIEDCIRADHRIVAPAIAYYEVLRELERLKAVSQIRRLRTFCRAVPNRFLSIKDANLDQAAALWAQARNQGKPTAGLEALDVDAILAAQAMSLGLSPSQYIVATTNVSHLSQFVPCDLWTNIIPG